MQMNWIRGIIASTVVGAAVGTVMIMRRRKISQKMMKFSPGRLVRKTRDTAMPMVRDNAKRWSSVFRVGTRALTRRLSRA